MTKGKGIGRGNNKNSHYNRPTVGGEETTTYLLPHHQKILLQVGNGNKSEGNRRIINLYSRDFSGMPYSGKVAGLLSQAIDAPEPRKTQLIKKALEYLESWSVEANYQEIKDEKVKKIGGSYIV